MRQIVANVEPGREIHLIADNLSTHKTKAVEAFLIDHPHLHLHFTPTYSSWLNQVEIWFSKIQHDIIARGIFASRNDLKRKIMRYIRFHNAHAKPFRWTYRNPRSSHHALAFSFKKLTALETNYRSTQPILDATNRIIGLSRKRHAKKLRSVKGNGLKPTLITCEREEDQTDFVVEKVLEHNESGLGLWRQAILVRTAYWSDHLEVELTRRNIPYRKYGGLKFLEAAHIKDLMSFLRVLENPRDQLAWMRILRLLEGVGPAVAERACEAVAESGGDVAALKWVPASAPVQAELTKLANLIRSLSRKNTTENVASDIERIRSFYDPLIERLYENADPRKRDLEQLEQISSAYSSRAGFSERTDAGSTSSHRRFCGTALEG